MADMNEDRLGDFAKKKVAESDARMKKLNPKGRKLDKRGNPIVTKEELEASGMSLRDFLNKERGLTRRVTAAEKRAAIPAYKGPDGDAGEKEASVPNSMAAIREYAKQYSPEMTDTFKKGGSVKGYGMARGGKVCKMR